LPYAQRAEEEKNTLIADLNTALAEVKTLQGIIPICSSCKKIRDDEGFWHQVEAYVGARSTAQFSHGICNECLQACYPEDYEEVVTMLTKDSPGGPGAGCPDTPRGEDFGPAPSAAAIGFPPTMAEMQGIAAALEEAKGNRPEVRQ
jgi:hypothetical protein